MTLDQLPASVARSVAAHLAAGHRVVNVALWQHKGRRAWRVIARPAPVLFRHESIVLTVRKEST